MTNLLHFSQFNNFIESNLKNIKSNIPETKDYILSIFSKFLRADNDLSDKTIILEFEKAKSNYSFTKFQELADWLLYGLSVFPNHFNHCSEDYYISIGQISYYKCHKILNNQWPLFEELSDNLDIYINEIRNSEISRGDNFK